MRMTLVNLNDMVKENPDYVVKITGDDEYGRKIRLLHLRLEPFPVIVTSKMLTTGVDCK